MDTDWQDRLSLLDLPWLAGVVCIAIALLVICGLIWPRNPQVPSILINKRYKLLFADYKNPEIKFGGLLGIMLGLIKVGVVLVALGICIKVISWLV